MGLEEVVLNIKNIMRCFNADLETNIMKVGMLNVDNLTIQATYAPPNNERSYSTLMIGLTYIHNGIWNQDVIGYGHLNGEWIRITRT